MTNLPVACTLSPSALGARREGLLSELLRRAEEHPANSMRYVARMERRLFRYPLALLLLCTALAACTDDAKLEGTPVELTAGGRTVTLQLGDCRVYQVERRSTRKAITRSHRCAGRRSVPAAAAHRVARIAPATARSGKRRAAMAIGSRSRTPTCHRPVMLHPMPRVERGVRE